MILITITCLVASLILIIIHIRNLNADNTPKQLNVQQNKKSKLRVVK